MTSRCSSSSCLNGNCQGCKNGVKYCNDPRCYPNCPDCSEETSVNCVKKRDGWDLALMIIITVLSILALILIGLMAWGWYNDEECEDQEYHQYQNQTALRIHLYNLDNRLIQKCFHWLSEARAL